MTKFPDWNRYQRERRLKIKTIVLKHYSNELLICSCCGDNHIEFLTLDHINNDGAKERKSKGSSYHTITFYNSLIKNNFPNGYDVLCFNCNTSKGFYGMCPHKRIQ